MNHLATRLRFIDHVGVLYIETFLRPLWAKYPNRGEDDWEALMLFLEGYAFARQGAPNDFIHAACDAMEELREAGFALGDSNTAHEAWGRFSALLGNSNVNHANNPLCPKGTVYARRYKRVAEEARTSGLSAVEFVSVLAQTDASANMVTCVKKKLEAEKATDIHQALSRINGIGAKVASLFLRDLATFYDVFPSADRRLLQPIDVWVRRISAQLMGETSSDDKIARWIVQEAKRNGCSPERVNQGMWYFGSQVARSKYRLSRALDDATYTSRLFEEHAKSRLDSASAFLKQ